MEPQKKELLFEHWHQIPAVQYHGTEKFEVMKHQIRASFLKALRKGIKDGEKTRHALTLKEIQPMINEDLDRDKDKIPLTTLYYHKDILEDEGLIKEVLTVREGKTQSTYYGRTAKGYVHNVQDKLDVPDPLKKIIFAKNPGIRDEDLEDLINHLVQHMNEVNKRIEKWIDDNQQFIAEHELDVLDIYEMFTKLLPPTGAHKELLSRLSELIGFD